MTDDCDIDRLAAALLRAAHRHERRIATAESCSGGLVASLLTDIDGLSHVFERGFVTYSDEAKREMLGVPARLLERHGAVSAEVAAAMADGAIDRSGASAALAITGFAGPAGPDDEEGLVFLTARVGERRRGVELHLGPAGRTAVRDRCARAGIGLLLELIEEAGDDMQSGE